MFYEMVMADEIDLLLWRSKNWTEMEAISSECFFGDEASTNHQPLARAEKPEEKRGCVVSR